MDEWLFLLQQNIDDLDIELQKKVYHEFYQTVYKDAFYLTRDHTATEDIVQDAFIKIAVQGHKAKYDSHLSAWVKQIARNTALDWLRNNKKYLHCISDSYMELTSNEVAVSQVVEITQRNQLLYQSIEELKPNYRALLYMYYIEEKSYKEICDELNLSEQVVTQRLARARKKLLKHFSGKWNDHDK
ncbi:sigma-70 family RNA polymerase sigma factor [Paenibacillus sonchi]|uniref:Sigma-70 family RNA polymerase sigma factor n=1 Tax=Paenibacillus sonchi TaxID=373687 RepID=A0A974SF69_9BACL|nr:sigma-70 family RNA polymerase sigma factor [Paenibacillus sonchi]QQZ62981.1 sigma-70 family RNA polymerase sigma factor [Paenibacillus sonchi]